MSDGRSVQFGDWDCVVSKDAYSNGGRIALLLEDAEDGSRIATATLNIPDVPLADNEVLIKDYSENAGMLVALIEAGIVIPTGKYVETGFVTVPVCQYIPPEPDEPSDGMTDAEADADTLASAGWGTDEDYGYYGGDE